MNAAIDWRERAKTLSFRNRAFIDGAFQDAASGETFEDVSPIDGAVIAKVAADYGVLTADDCNDADVTLGARAGERDEGADHAVQLVGRADGGVAKLPRDLVERVDASGGPATLPGEALHPFSVEAEWWQRKCGGLDPTSGRCLRCVYQACHRSL